MKFLQDQLSNLMVERRAGNKEGITQLVRKMAKKGIAPKEIAKMTDLEEEEVMELLNQK
jgi:hypothetical protein